MMVLVLHHREMEIKVITLPVLLEAIGITSLFPAHLAVVNHTTIYLHIKQFIGGSEPLKQSVSIYRQLQTVAGCCAESLSQTLQLLSYDHANHHLMTYKKFQAAPYHCSAYQDFHRHCCGHQSHILRGDVIRSCYK